MPLIRTILTVLALCFALLAAGLWWWSATIKTPSHFDITVTIGSVHPDAPSLAGTGSSLALLNLGRALSRQATLSGAAAICAGVSTLCQAVAAVIL